MNTNIFIYLFCFTAIIISFTLENSTGYSPGGWAACLTTSYTDIDLSSLGRFYNAFRYFPLVKAVLALCLLEGIRDNVFTCCTNEESAYIMRIWQNEFSMA